MQSEFLFSRPSLIEGLARIMDFGNTLNAHRQLSDSHEADLAALRMDWGMIGQDFREVIGEYEQTAADMLAAAG